METVTAKRTTLTSEPGYMWAVLFEGLGSYQSLEVYVSPVVDKTWPMYQPVVGFLGDVCTLKLSEGTVEDEDMFFGEAVKTSYGIYETCPGASVPHICEFAREEKVTPLEAK